MTIDELIEWGEQVRIECCIQNDSFPTTIAGEKYTTWLNMCSQRLLKDYPDNPLTQKFVDTAENANGNFITVYENLMGILKSFSGLYVDTNVPIDSILNTIFSRFHRMVKSIKNRHDKRATIEIKDEYDVQDLLLGVLRIFVDDIRPENYVPSYAGGNARVDFLLPSYGMCIETKMIRPGLTDSKVGDELVIDIARYQSQCSTLVCFIYDSEGMLDNPYGLISDLENMSTDDLKVKVYVNPL